MVSLFACLNGFGTVRINNICRLLAKSNANNVRVGVFMVEKVEFMVFLVVAPM